MRKKNLNSLPFKLKMIRTEAGKSQAELASELGISRSSLANYETGKRQPDIQTLTKIAEICHVMTDCLLDHLSYHDVVLNETPSEKSSRLKKLVQSRGTVLDLSSLPIEHKISMISYYDYVLSRQHQEEKGQNFYRVRE